VTFKIPAKLGAVADLLYRTRRDRLALQKKVAELDARETALEEHLIRTLPKSDASGVAGRLARATITPFVAPQVEDWDAFYKFILRTKRFEFLQKRLGKAAIEEVWETGREVPGVGRFRGLKVGLNKL
jgi:hypothetical protein